MPSRFTTAVFLGSSWCRHCVPCPLWLGIIHSLLCWHHGRYAEYLADSAVQAPTTEPFISLSRSIALTQIDFGEHCGPELTIDKVLATLTVNHIPLAWVDHAYTYGLHYLNNHYNHSPKAEATYQDVDNECICWLGVHGLSPAIPE